MNLPPSIEPALPFRRPRSICILRLSALGDVVHTVPVLRALQRHWPDVPISWVVGRQEAPLIADIAGLECIIVDKSAGMAAYRDLRHRLRGRCFDLLLHMQLSLRSHLFSRCIAAHHRLGFDRNSAQNGQAWFVNHRLQQPDSRRHMADSLLDFVRALQIDPEPLQWDIPLSDAVREWAAQLLPRSRRHLLVSPCSSAAHRDWPVQRYVTALRYAQQQLGLHVVLVAAEQPYARACTEAIASQLPQQALNLCGQTDLKQLLALLQRADLSMASDSGPLHLATACGRPVIALFAASDARCTGPYRNNRYLIDRYPEALMQCAPGRWRQRRWPVALRRAGLMQLISVAEVCAMLDRCVAELPATDGE